ncbi:hypothetical protein ACERII_01725 [Evansella sp. AB-rgal1]|uniref:hypothetical protein n=1 Tax=Evansella sp. AB-rgal1 TaxID=3242696 RepID=UPI00359D5976
MTNVVQSKTIHNCVLYLILEIVALYKRNEWPSPTIRELSHKIGYSEETILESLEFGKIEPVSILQ